MAHSDEIYKDIFNAMSDGIYFIDVNRIITFWNKGAEIITGYSSSDVVGTHCYDNILVHVDDEGRQLCKDGCPLFDTIQDGQTRNLNVYLHHKEGHRVHVNVTAYQYRTPNGTIIGAVEIFKDITSTVKDPETIEHLKEDDHFDVQTGLVNRSHIEMKLSSSFEEYVNHDIPFGIIMADIDNLTDINSSYGNDFGDKVIKMVAKTLAGNVRSCDACGRWDGGKFAGIVTQTNKNKLLKLTNKLRMLVEKSFIHHNNINVSVTISIGATLARYDDTFGSLIDRTVILLSQCKNSGKNKVMIDSGTIEPYRKRKKIKRTLFQKKRLFVRNYQRYYIILAGTLLALLWLWIIFLN